MTQNFWAITTFFNPARYKNKFENYCRFRDQSKSQGLNLLTLELAFNDEPFELKKNDADVLISVRGGKENILWQKERLLNLGMKELPSDCDKLAWIDADILFTNSNWVSETCTALENFPVVQPFQNVVRLPQGKKELEETEDLPQGRGELEIGPGMAYGQIAKPQSYKNWEYHAGYCWAFRREFIQKHGFFDLDVMGGSDKAMACAFYPEYETFGPDIRSSTDAFVASYRNWAQPVSEDCQGRVGYVLGRALHLWHGSREERLYFLRSRLYRHFDFDPKRDLKIDRQGLWSWQESARGLAEAVKETFFLRNEMGERSIVTKMILEELSDAKRKLKSK